MKVRRMKRIFPGCVAILLTTAAPVSADTVRFSLGAWQGPQKTELQYMRTMDALIDDDLLGRPSSVAMGYLATGWNSPETTSVPVRLQYFHNIAGKDWEGMSLMLGAGGVQHRTDYKYTALSTDPSIGPGGFRSDTQTNADGEIGFRLKPLMDGKLILLPKLGQRQHTYRSKYWEMSFAKNSFSEYNPSQIKADAAGGYGGLELKYKLSNTVSLVGEYLDFSNLSGDAHQLVSSYSSATVGTITSVGQVYNFYQSSYKLKGHDQFIGLEFNLQEKAENLRLQVGAREESMQVSYPGRLNLFVYSYAMAAGLTVTTQTVLPKADLLSNLLIYGSNHTRSKGSVYVGIVYDLDLGGTGQSQPPRRR